MNKQNLSEFKFKFDEEKVANYMSSYLYQLSSYQGINPVRLFVFPSNKCNDRCKYCAEHTKVSIKKDFFNNKDYIDKLVIDIEDVGFKDIHLFGGGEPFFYKDNMFYFLEKMLAVDSFLRIITNGANLTDMDIRNIVKSKFVSQLNITLNEDNESVADKLYFNKERHKNTVSVLESISKYKKMYKQRYPLVHIMFVLCNENYNQIPKIASILNDMDIEYFFIQPLRIDHEDCLKLQLTNQQKEEFLMMIPEVEKVFYDKHIRSNINNFKINRDFIEDSRDHKSVVKNKLLFNKNSKIGCYYPLITFAIWADGRMPKCFSMRDEFYKRNYFSLVSLKKFFKNKDFVDFTKQFIGEYCISNCKKCSICVLDEIEEIKKRMLNAGE